MVSSTSRARLAAAALTLAILASPGLVAATTLPALADIERRLAEAGSDQVNAELQSQAPSALADLHRRTADCELAAVSLAMRLSRSSYDPQVHVDALRLANGRCTRFVLAIAAPGEIAKFCASLDSWGPAQTARELRRRIGAIEADRLLRLTEPGKSCRAAYLYELNNSRVMLRKKA